MKYLGKSKQNFIVNDGFSDGFSEELPSSEGIIFKFDNKDIANDPEVLSKIADRVRIRKNDISYVKEIKSSKCKYFTR